MDTPGLTKTEIAAQNWARERSAAALVPKWQLFFNYFDPSFKREFIEALGQAYIAGIEYAQLNPGAESEPK